MAEHDAFTAGVKPGGLTSSTQIRLLLCYLVRCAGPLTRQEMETALLEEQLVNYFEFCSGLQEITERGLVREEEQGYMITPRGVRVCAELEQELPRSVRNAAVKAAVRAQIWNKKSAQYHAEITETEAGCSICCTIEGVDRKDFALQLMMPDRLTAELIQRRFILRGSQIYKLLLDALTEPGKDE